jgi:hypothetical protein
VYCTLWPTLASILALAQEKESKKGSCFDEKSPPWHSQESSTDISSQYREFEVMTLSDALTDYSVKCRTKREMKNAKSITMKNGKPATQGVCPVCGTKMFRIGKA